MKKSIASLITAAALTTVAIAPAAAQEAPADNAGSSAPAVVQTQDNTDDTNTGGEQAPNTPWLAFLQSSEQGPVGTILAVVLGIVTIALTAYTSFKDVLPNPANLLK